MNNYKKCLIASLCLSITPGLYASDHALEFTKIKLTDKFWTEAPAIGDIDRDGHMDIVVGPYWYRGPDFKKRYMISAATETFERTKADGSQETVEGFEGALGAGKVTNNTDSHFTKIIDLNNDGWPDVLVVGMEPGQNPNQGSSVSASWYENPGRKALTKHLWKRHLVAENVGSFCVDFFDLFGDGAPVLLGMSIFAGMPGGQVGYFKPDGSDASKLWIFHPISAPSDEYHWFEHGLGHGDVNGDGRIDVLASDGWWEQPESHEHDVLWTFHPFPFALGPGQIRQGVLLFDIDADGRPSFSSVYGGSQMYVQDLNRDGFPDVIMSLAAHGYGLAWWEQLKDRDRFGNTQFKRHIIINKKPSENKYGVVMTEMQAIAFEDLDGDGLKDIVTGKRFWSHGGGDIDPESSAPATLYWFKQTRNADGIVEFIPYLVDNDSGAGAQIAVGDVNGDGRPDIVVANKKGAFVFIQKKP